MIKPFLLVTSLFVTSTAIADPVKDTIEYRQSSFKMAKYHMGVMGGMVKGKIDYDAATFLANAKAMQAISSLAPYGFSVKSTGGDSEALPAIWENPADFKTKLDAFEKASAELVTASESGSMGTIKPAFGALANSCKSCHKEYRED